MVSLLEPFSAPPGALPDFGKPPPAFPDVSRVLESADEFGNLLRRRTVWPSLSPEWITHWMKVSLQVLVHATSNGAVEKVASFYFEVADRADQNERIVFERGLLALIAKGEIVASAATILAYRSDDLFVITNAILMLLASGNDKGDGSNAETLAPLIELALLRPPVCAMALLIALYEYGDTRHVVHMERIAPRIALDQFLEQPINKAQDVKLARFEFWLRMCERYSASGETPNEVELQSAAVGLAKTLMAGEGKPILDIRYTAGSRNQPPGSGVNGVRRWSTYVLENRARITRACGSTARQNFKLLFDHAKGATDKAVKN